MNLHKEFLKVFPVFSIGMGFILMLVCILANAQTFASNELRWADNRKLSWQDFTGTVDPNRNANVQAVAKVGIDLTTRAENDTVWFEVQSSFIKNGSWTINRTSDYLLQHEQLHFDIAELHARKLRKRLGELRGLTFSNLRQKVHAIYQDLQKQHENFQQRYDAETNHSNNQRMQKVWNSKVEQLLLQWENYNDPLVHNTIR